MMNNHLFIQEPRLKSQQSGIPHTSGASDNNPNYFETEHLQTVLIKSENCSTLFII